MKTTSLFVSLLLSTQLFASGLMFGEPAFSGPGCLSNTVSYTLSPNNNSLSILLAPLSLAANSGTGIVRTFCGINVPVTTQNQTIISADYRGFHDLPETDSFSSRRVTYTLENRLSQNQLDEVSGIDINNYLHTHQANITCAGTRVLKIFVDAFLKNPSSTQNATYSLDSIDLAEAGVPGIALQICKNSAAMISSVAIWAVALASLFSL